MRMSNSGGTPRKFSEKIAILERKQNEENTNFEDIMRQVRSITHEPGGNGEINSSATTTTTTAPMQIPQQGTSGGLLPPQQPWSHNLGGSLPNVHQMPSYSPPQWPPNWHNDVGSRIMVSHRSRSPEGQIINGNGSPHHYHPYGGRVHGRSPDRVPPLHPHHSYNGQGMNVVENTGNNASGNMGGRNYHHLHNQQGHLVPPSDSWNQINRARSDPAIHNMGMIPMMSNNPNQQYLQNSMPGPSGYQQHQQAQQAPTNGISPLQSPVNHMMHPMYNYQNGSSPMQSPMGSPHASSLMLDGGGGGGGGGSNTPCMELSPPGMRSDFNPDAPAASLPNLGAPQQQQQQQHHHHQPSQPPAQSDVTNYYHQHHQPIGPRHSTGACGPRLVPGPMMTPESSQSAPTSPHNQLDPNQQPMWPMRTFSNSPEALDIPKLVLTNAEGTPGQHVDCFNDLQDLTLNSNDLEILCNGSRIQPDQFQEMLQN